MGKGTELASLGIIIDPTGAKQGGREVNTALNKIQRGAGTTVGSFSKLKRSIFSVQSALATVGVGFSFINIIKTTKDFSASISELSAITGAVGDDLDFLRNKAKEFGETTTKTASEAATGFLLIASAKPDLLRNSEALAMVTKEALILAEAAGITIPDAAIALGGALNMFSAGSEEASRFINVLAAGAKEGAAAIPLLTESLRDSGQVAHIAGLSFEESIAMLEGFAIGNVKGARAGVAFRNMLSILSSQGNDQFKPTIVGMSNALDNLRDHFEALPDETARINEAIKIFQRENYSAALGVIYQSEKVRELTTALHGTNEAYTQARVRFDNLKGDLLRLGSVWEALNITIGEGTEGSTRKATQDLSQFVSFLNTVAKGTDDAKAAWIDFGMELQHGDTITAFDNLTAQAEQFSDTWTIAIDDAIVDMDGLAFAIAEVDIFLGDAFLNFPMNIKTGVIVSIGEFDKLRVAAIADVDQIEKRFEQMKLILSTVGEVVKAPFTTLPWNSDEELERISANADSKMSILKEEYSAIEDKAKLETDTINLAIDLAMDEREEIINKTAARLEELKVMRAQKNLMDEFVGPPSSLAPKAEIVERSRTAPTGGTVKLTEKELAAFSKLQNSFYHTTERINVDLIRDATERNEALLDIEANQWSKRISVYEEGTKERIELEDLYLSWHEARTKQLIDTLPYNQMLADWEDTTTKMSELSAKWSEDTIDAFIDSAESGKFEWKAMVSSMIKDMAKLQMMKGLPQSSDGINGGSLFGSLLQGFGSMMLSGSIGGGAGALTDFTPDSDFVVNLPQTYAKGGISNVPAIFGEAGTAEAAVPLPDGRRIPVDLRTGDNSSLGNSINNFHFYKNVDDKEIRRSAAQAGQRINEMSSFGNRNQ